MRLLPLAAVAALVLSPALLHAQTTPAAPVPVTPVPVTPVPVTPLPATPAPGGVTAPAATVPPVVAPKHGRRQTLQQHFDSANTTHDGHLTKEQAAGAKWTYVTKHFDAIDKDHKGYVTIDDIHAYSHAAHAAHHMKPPAPAAAPAPATTTN